MVFESAILTQASQRRSFSTVRIACVVDAVELSKLHAPKVEYQSQRRDQSGTGTAASPSTVSDPIES